jgi:hypothetical protein
MKKISLFIPNWSMGDLIKNKKEAIKSIVFLMSEWNISIQDFVNEYNKIKKVKQNE